MTYALRKLIAFVFLGGIFWFIYQDLENLNKPWFMHALGMMVVVFAFFWLLVPVVVVRYRIYCRRRQNRERFAKWREELGPEGLQPIAVKKEARLALGQDERAFLHEKGTLYVPMDAGLGEDALAGSPSEVAFPNFNRRCGRIQRTHCYVTDRKLYFAGKTLAWPVPFADLRSALDAPGGLVFKIARGDRLLRVAFTFQNPLVAAEVIRFARSADGAATHMTA